MNDSPTHHDADTLAVLAALQDGLALVPRPYAELAARAGVSEARARQVIEHRLADGVVKRLGVIVRHHELGYVANAMVVFDVADAQVDRLGALLSGRPGVTLCYRRTRHRPHWPYNLFCMVHGRDHDDVRKHIERLRGDVPGLSRCPFAVLFSTQRFKQCGARPIARAAAVEPAHA